MTEMYDALYICAYCVNIWMYIYQSHVWRPTYSRQSEYFFRLHGSIELRALRKLADCTPDEAIGLTPWWIQDNSIPMANITNDPNVSGHEPMTT